MRLDRFGGFLLMTGAIVAVIAVVGLAVGFEPSQLPPKLLDIAAYKLTFGAAAVLLAVGAIVRRHAKSVDDSAPGTKPGSISRDASPPPAQLPQPATGRDGVNGPSGRDGQKAEVKVRR